MGAGFLAPFGWVARDVLDIHEPQDDSADVKLGLAAIEVGQSLKAYYQ